MQVLLAVVEDLYTFAVSVLFSRRAGTKDVSAPLYLPPSRIVSPLRETVDIDVYRDTAEVFWGNMTESIPANARMLPQKNTIVYCTRAHVPLRTMPEDGADSAIATLEYGDMVMLLDRGNEYAYVAVGNKKGYVPAAALAQEAASVYPDFVIGAENSALDANTVRLRFIIRDEFSASLTQLPLQAHEYVYYKLLRRGAHIAWPDIRPRTAGTWAKILSSLEGIVIGDTPTVGSVMEYMLPEGEAEGNNKGRAHLAYVEKVLPNETIHISEVDWSARGVYNERILAGEEWRAYAPVFIAIG
jgi:hypothetical protein